MCFICLIPLLVQTYLSFFLAILVRSCWTKGWGKAQPLPTDEEKKDALESGESDEFQSVSLLDDLTMLDNYPKR